MKRAVFTLEEANDMTRAITERGARWYIARPLNYIGFGWRIRAALAVLKGEAFPVEWRG